MRRVRRGHRKRSPVSKTEAAVERVKCDLGVAICNRMEARTSWKYWMSKEKHLRARLYTLEERLREEGG